MKFSFKIATEPTVHAAAAITIVTLSSTAMAAISIILGNPIIIIYCVSILTLILWLVLIVHFIIAKAVRAPIAPTPQPPPFQPPNQRLLKKKNIMDPDGMDPLPPPAPGFPPGAWVLPAGGGGARSPGFGHLSTLSCPPCTGAGPCH